MQVLPHLTKKTVRRDFSFCLSSTFIFEPILINIYMNANIMNMQLINLNKMTSKVIEGFKSSSNFSVNPTLPLLDGPLMFPLPNCVDLTLQLVLSSPLLLSLSISLFCSMQK